MIRKRLTLGLGANAFDKIAIALVQLLMVPVLANAWGLNLYGIWAIMMTVPAFLGLGDFGIVSSAGARMTASVARSEWDEARRTLHTAWVAALGIVAVAGGLAALVIYLVPVGTLPVTEGFADADSRLTLLLLLAYGFTTIVFRLNTAAFRAALRYTFAALCSTAVYVIENLAAIIVIVLGGDPVQAALALLLARLLFIAGLLLTSFRELPRLSPGIGHASLSEWSQMWRPALAASALGFGMIGYLQGSVLILGALAGAAAVPAFIAVRTISRLGVQMSSLVSVPVMQEFGAAMGQADHFRAGRLFGLIAATSLILSVAMGVGLELLGSWFVAFWTSGAIHADQQLLTFMAISSVAAMLWSPLSNLILAINRQHAFSYANLAASGAGLVFIWLTAGSMGSASAGASFALVDCVTLGAVIIFIAKTWQGDERFRAGALATLHELRSPLTLLKSVRHS